MTLCILHLLLQIVFFFQVQMSKSQNNHKVHLKRRRLSLWDVNILDLPPRLYCDICDDLNLPNVLGRDWRLLAGVYIKKYGNLENTQ